MIEGLGRDSSGKFVKGHPYGKRFSSEYRPVVLKGVHRSPNTEFKAGFIPWNKGKPGYAAAHRGRSRPDLAGEKNPAWRGGLPNCTRCKTMLSRKDNKTGICKKCQHENSKLRVHTSNEYIAWRKAVFARDGYTCQSCGQTDCYVEADHIKPWSLYPESRFDINNGRTLCRKCHEKTDTYGWKLYHSKELVGV